MKPIKILFSQSETIEKNIKDIFKEILGPLGESEFNKLKEKGAIFKEALIDYINTLYKTKILDKQAARTFKQKIRDQSTQK